MASVRGTYVRAATGIVCAELTFDTPLAPNTSQVGLAKAANYGTSLVNGTRLQCTIR